MQTQLPDDKKGSCAKQLILKRHLFYLGVGGFALFVLSLSHFPCPFRFFTTIPCPTCGMTRAAEALFSGDWTASLAFHPLLLPTAITLPLFFHHRLFPPFWKRIVFWWECIFLCTLMAVYFFRLWNGMIP